MQLTPELINDPAAFQKLIDWHVAEGTDGIVVVGTTGESPTVDFDEHTELIRLAVMRASDLLFAPDEQAVLNLRELRLRGEILPVSANTVVEQLRHSLPDPPEPGSGPVIVTMHRVENLRSTRRTDQLVADGNVGPWIIGQVRATPLEVLR